MILDPLGQELLSAAVAMWRLHDRLVLSDEPEVMKLNRRLNACLARVCVEYCRQKNVGLQQFEARVRKLAKI